MRSCLYECSVMHHRLEPVRHHFRYRIFMFALDLDELDTVAGKVRGFSHNGRNLYEFRDGDHFAIIPGSLKENVIALLARNGIQFPARGRILFVTLPRILGYVFNPVSFFFCEDAEGAPLCAVAQVGNTFGEMKVYFLGGPNPLGAYRQTVTKNFYVSPFSTLDTAFDFKLKIPGDQLDIHIDDSREGRRTLLSSLTGRRAGLTSARLAWFTVKYPLLSLRVIFLIHWNALLLWLKRTPWIAKGDRPQDQREVLRPHVSLSGRVS